MYTICCWPAAHCLLQSGTAYLGLVQKHFLVTLLQKVSIVKTMVTALVHTSGRHADNKQMQKEASLSSQVVSFWCVVSCLSKENNLRAIFVISRPVFYIIFL